jgi:hypothetical protein
VRSRTNDRSANKQTISGFDALQDRIV